MHEGEFYVGYLATPPSYVRFLRRVIPPTLVVLACVMAGVALLQRDPGRGRWDTGATISVTGTVASRPYPAVFLDEDEAYLLVETGKRGAQQRVAAADGKRATVTGWLLERDGRRILELAPEDSAVRVEAGDGVVPEIRDVPTFAPIVARGEIVDAKCYLGAMKPGDGKGHKACATLCVGAGIPPMFVSNEGGTTSYHLVVDAAHGAANGLVAEVLGEPVEARPTLAKWGPFDVYVVGEGAVSRR